LQARLIGLFSPDGIGFGGVFPYMGARSKRMRQASVHAAKPDECSQFLMTSASELRSGKTHRDENFPVASWIIHPRHRALILSFYNFVRTADDIADHATLAADEKLRYLDLMEAELLGKGDTQPEAVNLRRALAERAMPPRHALDVLVAFRMDVTKLRYENWDDVIHYCRYSAMPVGRFMLDVHGESTSTWAASDALCAGLQINNHLQDCAKDYKNLNRVYLPRDALASSGASVEMLGEAKSPPALLACLRALAVRTEAVLDEITGPPRPAVRSTRRCASCRANSAMRCSRSTISAGRSTTLQTLTDHGPSGWRRSSNGATTSTRCIRAVRRSG